MTAKNALLTRLNNMLAAGTDNALLRFSLGQAHLAAGTPDLAVEHLEQAVKFDENYSAAWKMLGKALNDCGRKHDAVMVYEQGITVAQTRGDMQAAREMEVFLKRLRRTA